MPGFDDVKIPVELEVVDADLDEVAADRAGYDYVGNTFATGDGARNVVGYLIGRGYNMVYVGMSRIVPGETKDGSFAIKDFSFVASLSCPLLFFLLLLRFLGSLFGSPNAGSTIPNANGGRACYPFFGRRAGGCHSRCGWGEGHDDRHGRLAKRRS